MKSIFTQPYTSWTHRLSRVLVRPLVGTRVTPNNLTTGRLVSGLAGCAAFMIGDPIWDFWGGLLWLVSCLLDRADGELARMGGMTSATGHRYDYYCDIAVNGLFFLAIGIGLRDGEMNSWAVVLGFVAGASVAAASILSEMLERASPRPDKAYVGILGFDFDDLLYLLGPAAWFGLFPYILIGAAACAPILVVLTWTRLARLRQSEAR